MDLITPVIVELKRRLEEDLPVYVDAINLQYADEYAIPYPAAVLDYPPPLTQIEDTPTLCLVDGPSDFVNDRGAEAEAEHRVVAVCYMQSTDPRALAWQLRRYSRAMVEGLIHNRTGNPAFWGIQLDGITPGPALGRQSNPGLVFSWTSVSVRASTDES
jgi:hypothetical protein